ncbi:MAG: cytochrome P450 [Acidimicrobiales bacterium]|nr:cytochrome P450 [Acidimicrobiales bacterium]
MPPVSSWDTDYDIFDPAYVADPYPIWDGLRATCPIAHSDRWGGSWLPTRYADISAIAHDVEHFSSAEVGVVSGRADAEGAPLLPAGVPPISSDPPVHTWARRLLLPWFSHRAVDRYEPFTRQLCRDLLDGFADGGRADAAADYAQQIPVRVIASVLGVPGDMADTFTGWVRDVLEFAHDDERREAGTRAAVDFFVQQIAQRKERPGTDLISELLHAEVDGQPVPEEHVLGTVALTLVAGVDTTWSAIGSALWHLGTHPDDRRRLVAEPGIWPTAIEELLRAYAPVTMARLVTADVEVGGCPMRAGDKVLLSFPAANRDPEAFPDADQVLLDRQHNRHVAFGVGIHRCAGSNLARMELRVALEEWLARIPEFRVEDPDAVTWAGGQVRGPRDLPVVFP